MRSRSLIVLAAALFIGLVAVLIVNGVFTGVEQRQAKAAEDTRQVRIAVATQDVAFGTPLSAQNVRLANWPASSVPAGAFTTLEDATRARVALRPMVTGEPVLASKVSGENGRATLSANLPAGQLAFAVPIDAVAGAGGFVRPGDVVDVLVTRQIPGDGASQSDKMTDIVLESIPVLASTRFPIPTAQILPWARPRRFKSIALARKSWPFRSSLALSRLHCARSAMSMWDRAAR